MSTLNPAITFQINLIPDAIGLLAPDRYQTDQGVAQAAVAFRPALINSWFPGLMGGENIEQKTANTFVAYGEKAHYILKTYCVPQNGQPAPMSVVAWNYSDGTSKAVGTSVPIYNGSVEVGTVTVQTAAPVVQA
jgi:hypothetical protein